MLHVGEPSKVLLNLEKEAHVLEGGGGEGERKGARLAVLDLS